MQEAPRARGAGDGPWKPLCWDACVSPSLRLITTAWPQTLAFKLAPSLERSNLPQTPLSRARGSLRVGDWPVPQRVWVSRLGTAPMPLEGPGRSGLNRPFPGLTPQGGDRHSHLPPFSSLLGHRSSAQCFSVPKSLILRLERQDGSREDLCPGCTEIIREMQLSSGEHPPPCSRQVGVAGGSSLSRPPWREPAGPEARAGGS